MPKRRKGKKSSHYLENNQPHKDWFDSEVGMGKQRGKPRANASNIKKEKGDFKKLKND